MESNYEWIGYIASFFVAVSFTVKDISKLRMINSIGAVAFAIYGFVIASYPVIATNVFILIFNIYYLIKKE